MNKVIMLLISLLVLTGCVEQNRQITEDEFMNDTIIEYFLYDAEISDWDAFSNEYLIDGGTSFEIDQVDISSLEERLTGYNNIQLTGEIDISVYRQTEESRLFMIPIFDTWTFDDIDLHYSYLDGELVFEITPNISNFPSTTIKFLVIQVDSIHSYEVSNN